MTVAVDEEEIFPRPPFAGPRFNLREIDSKSPECGEGVMERADLVADAYHQAGPIVAGRWTALSAEHEEARCVCGIILDVVFEDAESIFFCSEDAGDGGRVPLSGGELGGPGVGGSLDDFRLRQIVLNPATALGE